MVNTLLRIKNFFKIIIFCPLIFYFGHRSFIAYDEGFYALQAKWILDKGNWIIPLWWDKYVLDRTIGIQFLIAKSQEIFGNNTFSAYLPTTIAAITMLFATYKLHEELLDKKDAIISPLILATTYLWFDYSHLATQDIIYSCLVTIGILALSKIKSNNDKFLILLFGLWIGLAFMMKTFLVLVPLAALIPYIFTKKFFLSNKFFWIGLIVGFSPFLLWAYLINSYLDKNIIFYLLGKVNSLANKNNFTNPFYYYFWNIPISFLPWSIFSIFGLIFNTIRTKKEKLVLVYFPIILIIIISIFSTKTPYYPLQISSVLSLNSYVGIKVLFNSKKYKSFIVFITSKLIPLFLFSVVSIFLIFLESNLNFSPKEVFFVVAGLISFAIAWTFISNQKNINNLFLPLILGPYLLTTLFLQSGLFTDRSREIRESMENLYLSTIPKQQLINVVKSNMGNSDHQSKIIKISLLTNNLGDGIDDLNELNTSDMAWLNLSSDIEIDDKYFQIIFEDKNLLPWKLIKKIN